MPAPLLSPAPVGTGERPPRFGMLRVVVVTAVLYLLFTSFLVVFISLKTFPVPEQAINAAGHGAVPSAAAQGYHAPSLFSLRIQAPERLGPLVVLFRWLAVVCMLLVLGAHLPLHAVFTLLRRGRRAPPPLAAAAEQVALRSPLMTAILLFCAAAADVAARTLSLLGGKGYVHDFAWRSIPFYAVVALLISFFAYYWQGYRMKMIFAPFVFTRAGFIRSTRPRRKTVRSQIGLAQLITAILPLTLVILYLVAFASMADLRSLPADRRDFLLGEFQPLYASLQAGGGIPPGVPLVLPYLSVGDTLLFAGGVAAAFLISLVMLLLISKWYTHSLVDPIRELQGNMLHAAQGDLSRVTPVRDTDEVGELTESFNGMLASLRDGERLRGEKEAAESASRAKSSFLANMSHELRTPLNAIIGFAQLMERGENLDGEQRENLATITRSGTNLLSLINDILDMSKIEAGRVELNSAAFDLREMLQALEGMFSLRAREKGLTLIFDVAPDVPRYLDTDEGKLRQVIVNLLGNAIKFTPAGGATLRVRSRPDAAGSVLLLGEVEDSGVGITPEEIEHIFEPFTQTRSGASQEGTGLGLSISRRYAELMEGSLSVRSEAGKGSVFSFQVRARLADAAAAAPVRPRRKVTGLAPGQPEFRMIVAEDRDSNRDLLVKILQPLGFSVRGVKNGAECVSLWETWRPNLVWMDIRMPVMDGAEATRRIKADARGKDTVIIALTASAFDSDRREILAGGCDDFVRKPFVEEEIFAKLEEHLGVKFLYAEEPGAAAPAQPKPLAPDALAGTSEQWREALRRATVEADYERLLALAAEVRSSHPAAAESLSALISAFEYEKILQALDGTV